MSLTVIPIKADRKNGEFILFDEICKSLDRNNLSLQDGDVLVISSKFVSQSQGRVLDTGSIMTSRDSQKISEKFRVDPKLSEAIIRESDRIFGGISGFVLASSDQILAPNAGIDKSNTGGSKLILYPNKPYLIAEQIKRKFFLILSIHVGVIIVDSRLMPSRMGTIGITIGCAGIEPLTDMRGQKDLDGNSLKVTFQATSDNLASIANHKMGEGSESQPFAIVRDSESKLTNRQIQHDEMTISHEQCVYIRGFEKR